MTTQQETQNTEQSSATRVVTPPRAPENTNRVLQRPRGRRRERGGRRERSKPEFDQKILDIRRVTRVMAGGRRFSFSVGLVAGDRHGRVGVGIGKAGDTSLAIEKALKNAKKNMVKVELTKNRSLDRSVDVKYCAARIAITPAPGRGLIAGSSVRTVLELAGITDVTSKIHSRSKNKLNNARAAVKALQSIPTTAVVRQK